MRYFADPCRNLLVNKYFTPFGKSDIKLNTIIEKVPTNRKINKVFNYGGL